MRQSAANPDYLPITKRRIIKMKGIYSIEINGKFYIGKDVEIHKEKRLKQHLALLNNNSHYNKYLQYAFNKYDGRYKYTVLFSDDDIDNDELSDIEVFYISKFNTYKGGYNLTKGGEGGNGLVVSEEEKKNRSNRNSGEKNPLSKLSNDQFYEMVDLFKQGKTNSEIASMYGLHDRYISLIRHKKRFKKLWGEVKDYEPVKSNGNALRDSKLSEEKFIEIVLLIKEGWTNAAIERKYNLSAGTGSRIRHRKLYKIWWNKHFREDNQEGSTTIENTQ